MYEIRIATPQDIPAIRALAHKTWPLAYGNILSAEQISYMLNLFYSPGALQNQMDIAGHRFFVYANPVDMLGFASFSRITPEDPAFPKARLHKLYVSPDAQGKGIGQALLQAVWEAVQPWARHLELNVNRHNPARFFYEKSGFSILYEEDIDIGQGYFMNDYVMAKSC